MWFRIVTLVFVLALPRAAAMAQPGIAQLDDCLRPAQTRPQNDSQMRIAGLLRRLGPVLTALPSLRDSLGAANPDICLSHHLLTEHGYMQADGTRIVLNAKLPDAMLLAILLHELRHLDQLGMGACPSPDLSAQETARSVFAIEADSSAVMVLGTWWMAQNGDPGPWQAVQSWPSATDIAAAFATVMTNGGNTEQAVAAAFAQWYASGWRRDQYYLSSCSDYLDRLDRTKQLPRYQLMPPEFLQNLCRLPDGTPYPCIEPESALRR